MATQDINFGILINKPQKVELDSPQMLLCQSKTISEITFLCLYLPSNLIKLPVLGACPIYWPAPYKHSDLLRLHDGPQIPLGSSLSFAATVRKQETFVLSPPIKYKG